MKILLLGKNGQLGWELQRSLAALGELTALGRNSSNLCGDLTKLDQLTATLHAVKPDLIVNAAGHTAVDQAEREPELAHALNALAPQLLAQQAKQLDAWLLHYSSDYVFDGSGNAPWLETDQPSPLNVYGASKLAGERLIVESGAKHLILRTSWVYASRGNNFVRSMLRLAQERKRIQVVDDQIGAPTSAALLADISAHIAHQLSQRHDQANSLSGIYHISASGHTSWFDYARYVLAQAQAIDPKRGISPEQIEPIPSSAFLSTAKRPHNSRLNSQKLQATFKLALPPWQHGVKRVLLETLQ